MFYLIVALINYSQLGAQYTLQISDRRFVEVDTSFRPQLEKAPGDVLSLGGLLAVA